MNRLVPVGAAHCRVCEGLIAVLELEIPASPALRPKVRWHQRDRTCRCGTTNLPPVDRVPASLQMRMRSVLRDASRLQSWEALAPRPPLVLHV